MSDDNTFDARETAGEQGIVDPHQAGRDASDPTPEAPAGPGSATPDHSAWRRPGDGRRVRTSEVVGALEDTTPAPVHSMSRSSGARRAMPPEERAAAAAQATVEEPRVATQDGVSLPASHMAAVIGARAALSRESDPGARLDELPEVLASDDRPGRPLWLRLLPWLAGLVAVALIVAGIVFASTRKKPVVVTSTPTPTPSAPEVVTDRVLLTPADLATLAAAKTWKQGTTASRLTPTSPKVACLAQTTGQPNPSATRQRTLTTSTTNGLAALHQVDGYATSTEAHTAYAAKAAELARCDDVPTWLAGADKLTGLGDEATSVTIAYQDAVTQYHTVILARTGTVVHAIDVTQSNQGVPAAKVLPAATAVVNRQCTTSGGACARQATSTPAGPAPTDAPGWLVVSDIPRVSPGAGLWTSTDTQDVTTKGSGCENLTLAAAPGATKGEQRTYLMTQDDAAPQNFGMDEVVLTFPDARSAAAFAKTLTTNLQGCAKRLPTAKVSEGQGAAYTIDGSTLQAATQLTTLSMGGTATLRFRTAVVVNKTKVAYLVNNPTDTYDLGREKFLQVALRAGQRAGQAS